MADQDPASGDVSIPADADPDKTQIVTPASAAEASAVPPELGLPTEVVTSAPSAFDLDKTQIVTPGDISAPAPGADQPRQGRPGAGQPPKPPRPPVPAAPPPGPPVAGHRPAPSTSSAAKPQPPFPAAPPPQPPNYGAPHQGQPPSYGAPAQGQPPSYGGQTPPPQPPSYGAPHQGQPNYGGQTPPPPGFNTPQPGHHPGYGQPPGPGGYANMPPNSNHPYSANGAQSPMEAANALLAKGNSFIAQLMSRGINGELIRQPWFQAFRQSPQQSDQFVYVSYAIGIVLALVLGLMPGAVGTILSLAVGIALCYLYFALGTKRAHQFVAYGVCGVGVVLSVLSVIFSALTLIDVLSLRYSTGSAALMLIISMGLTVVAGLILGYIGLQVHRGIQRLERRQ